MKSAKALLFVGIVTAGLLISVGYVSISQDLAEIVDTKKVVIEQNDYNVEITDIETVEVNGTASAEQPTYTKTTATFNSEIVQYGDSIVYNVTITNNGSKVAKLSNVNITEQEDGSEAIYYSVDSPSEVLEPGASTTMVVVASYDNNYLGYTTSSSRAATATIQYTQAD